MLNVNIINFLGKKWPNVSVKLIKIDDYFYYKPRVIVNKTNKEGIVNFKDISGGTYLIEVSTKRIILQKIFSVDINDTIKIRMPSVFGWIKMEKITSENFRKEMYEKCRTDYENCFLCKKKYGSSVSDSLTKRFKCKYCEKCFCEKHHVPESHKCWGRPRPPPVNFTEIHHANGRVEVIVHG